MPANNTAATAIDIGTLTGYTPYTTSQDAWNGAGVDELWYSYLPVAGDDVLEVYAYGNGTTVLTAFTLRSGPPPAATVLDNNISSTSRPAQVDIVTFVTPGERVFLKIFASNVNPAIVHIRIARGQKELILAGDLYINDSSSGYPGVVMDPTTAIPKRYQLNYPAGEGQEVLQNGVVAVIDAFNALGIVLFDVQPDGLTLRATPTMPDTHYTKSLSSNLVNTFWATRQFGGGNSFAVPIDDAGNVGTPLDLGSPNFEVVVPQADNSAVYGMDGADLQKITVPGGVATTLVSGAGIDGVRMLTDDTIIGWKGGAGTLSVDQYDLTGTLVTNIPLTVDISVSEVEHLFADIEDPVYFWVWWQTSTENHFQKYRVSDGALITDLTRMKFIESVSQTTVLASETVFSGADFSCKPIRLTVVTTIPTVSPIPLSTPLAPETPCEPQAVVGNGGKGKAGCNVGGVGGGHEYVGGLGDVPQHPDPPDGEALLDQEANGIEPWIELIHEEYPASNGITIYRRAFEELADDPNVFESGRKESGVLAIGEIENALGNEQGGFEAATVEIQLSDIRDRLMRNLAADQDIDGDEVRVKACTDAGRAAGVLPRILARSIVQQSEIRSSLQAGITAVDWFFSDFGPFGPDRQDPSWTFNDLGASAPDMTDDTKATPIPRLYGEKSDEGATDPAGGSGSKSKGLLPGYYLGMFDIGSGTVPDPGPTPGKSLAEVVAELQVSVTAGTTVADWSSIIGVADAIYLESLGTVPDTYTRLADVIGYADLDVLLSMGTTAGTTSTLWGFVATGLGPWFAYTGVYGSNLGGGDPTLTHDRVKLDPLTRSDLLVPGINWPFVQPYVEFTNPDTGQVFWLTGVFVRGPLLDEHLNGVVNLAFNAIGTEEFGDGTGLPIMRAEDVKQHWLENHALNRWTSGPYTTTLIYPQWEDGTAKVRTSSFLARQNFFKTQFGSPTEGLMFSWYTDKQMPTLDVARHFNAETESKLGINGHGQIVDFGFDPSVDITTWPKLDHVTDVFGTITRTTGEERENVVTGFCDWDGDFDKFRIGPLHFESAAAIAQYKGRRKSGDDLEAILLDQADQLAWVLEQRLNRLKVGLTMLEVPLPLGWIDYDVGSGIRLTSEDGPGPNGYEDEPGIIMRRRIDIRNRLVMYTLWMPGLLLGSA